jgi:hypothetical protein
MNMNIKIYRRTSLLGPLFETNDHNKCTLTVEVVDFVVPKDMKTLVGFDMPS